MKVPCLAVVFLLQQLCLTPGSLAASPRTFTSEGARLFLVCSSRLDKNAGAPLQFFYDPEGGYGEITVVVTPPEGQDPIVYAGEVTYVGGARTDYSFAPQSAEGDYLYRVRTFLDGPAGGARGYFQGSGVEALPLQCQYI